MCSQVVKEQNPHGAVEGFCATRELRVTLKDPGLPPMNLLDLPGLINAPEEDKQRVDALVSANIDAHRESSLFLAVVPAYDSPRESNAINLVLQHRLEDRTIGVITKCDRLEEDDHELLLERLSNTPSEMSVPLQPYGYVAVMNKPLKPKEGEEGVETLRRQAEAEPRWFDDEFGDQIEPELKTTNALLQKVNQMYEQRVRETWTPRTVVRLCQEINKARAECVRIGQPEAPGKLAADEAAVLREAVRSRLEEVLQPLYTMALSDFATNTLQPLQQRLVDLLRVQSVPLGTTSAHLRNLRDQVNRELVERLTEDAIAGNWYDQVDAVLADDELPLRLGRFPRWRSQARELARKDRPCIAEDTLARVRAFVDRALAEESPHIKLTYDFSPRAAAASSSSTEREANLLPTVTVRVETDVSDWVLHHIVEGLSANRGVSDLLQQLENVMEPEVQETCHAQRQALLSRIQRADGAARQLLDLARDEDAVPQDPKALLEDLVQAVLNMPAAALQLSVRNSSVEGLGTATAGEEARFTIVTCDGEGERLGGGLPPTEFTVAVQQRAARPGPGIVGEVADHGDGTYAARFTVPDRVDAEAEDTLRFQCEVKLYGTALPGSPFPFEVELPRGFQYAFRAPHAGLEITPRNPGTRNAEVRVRCTSPNISYSVISTAPLPMDRVSFWTVRVESVNHPGGGHIFTGVIGTRDPPTSQTPPGSHMARLNGSLSTKGGAVEGSQFEKSQNGDELVFMFSPAQMRRQWASCSREAPSAEGQAARLAIHHKRHGRTATIRMPETAENFIFSSQTYHTSWTAPALLFRKATPEERQLILTPSP